jgi:hypothetical protein
VDLGAEMEQFPVPDDGDAIFIAGKGGTCFREIEGHGRVFPPVPRCLCQAPQPVGWLGGQGENLGSQSGGRAWFRHGRNEVPEQADSPPGFGNVGIATAADEIDGASGSLLLRSVQCRGGKYGPGIHRELVGTAQHAGQPGSAEGGFLGPRVGQVDEGAPAGPGTCVLPGRGHQTVLGRDVLAHGFLVRRDELAGKSGLV